jgi:glycosyltransferase involved in cell wall biosynthesis
MTEQNEPSNAGTAATDTASGEASDSRIKLLLWSSRGSGEHYHGPASFTYRLYSSAPAGRVDVTLAHGLSSQEQYPLFSSQHLISTLGELPWQRPVFIRKGCRWLDRHYQAFDVMHSISGYHHSVVPAVHAERLGLPAVLFVTNHNLEFVDKKGWKSLLGLPRKRRELVKELSALIAMSQDIYDELRSFGVPEEKIARIPMGVNTETFRPVETPSDKAELRKQLGWLDLPTLIFVGAVVKRKRPDLLVEAVGLLKKRQIDCQLAVVGPPNEENYLRRMKARAEELGVADRIVWFGFTREIAPLFKAADFFGLPSSNEGMAAALIEAMSCGLAPIVTPISGSVDVVRDGRNGRIVQPDAAEIADVLADYLREPGTATAHGQASRQIVLETYSNDAVFSSYERLFRRVMKGQPAAE